MPFPKLSHRVGRYARFLLTRLEKRFLHSDAAEAVRVLGTALIVGTGTGLIALVFRGMIRFVDAATWDGAARLLGGISPFTLLLLPAVGGALVGWLTTKWAPEARGPGVPEVMEAVALRRGVIPTRAAIAKAITAALTIGSGGSAGREGPIVHIGSTFGSFVGRVLRMPDNQVRNLVACGAAGGIAATFNAPIAGSLFALEVILGQFSATYFSAIVVSAVTADVVAQRFLGDARSFVVPLYGLESSWELVGFALLGILAGVGAVTFIRLHELVADFFDNSPLPAAVRPAVGGLLLGAVGLLAVSAAGFPHIFGVGYESMNAALQGELTLQLLATLLLLKMVATALTLGSGGSGGVFAPSLYMGAMLGGAFGMLLNALLPTLTAPPGAYALVGMAAFATGAVHTPVTLIVMLLELSGDYQLILPLMLGTVLSTVVSFLVGHRSIYTSQLLRRGVTLHSGKEIDVMQGILVSEGMSHVGVVAALDMPLADLAAQFARTHSHGFLVVDSTGQLAGAVSIGDYERALRTGDPAAKRVADIATTDNLIVAYPDEPMSRALRRLAETDISRIPVLAHPGSRELVGIIRRTDTIRAYDRALRKHAHHQHRVEQLRLEEPQSAIFGQIEMFSQAWGAGRTLGEIPLPAHCQFVSVRRGNKLYVAEPYTIMQADDVITLFGTPESVRFVTRQLTSWQGMDPDLDRQPRHRELTVPAGANCCGSPLMALNLPPDCLVISVRRGDNVIIAHGNTVLHAGDIVELFAVPDELDAAEALLRADYRQPPPDVGPAPAGD